MKNLLFVCFAIIPFLAKAQENQWMPNTPMTDSSHFNRNACMSPYDQNILFWDQELNSITTQLCYKDISSPGNPMHVALSQPGVKLTNPKILDGFTVFYQTNEGNDIDLKYFFFNPNGTITDPVFLSALPGDDVNLSTGGAGMVAWENSGKIWISQYQFQYNDFSVPVAIDSIGVNSPVFTANNNLTYLKHNGDSTYVISVYPTFNQGVWVIYSVNTKSFSGYGSALTTYNPWAGSNLCMQNQVGSDPSGLVIIDGLTSGIEYINSPIYNYTQPAICDYMIGVKSNTYFLAYVSDSLTQNEVFARVSFFGENDVKNISQWAGDDRNPQFFVTFPQIYIVRVYLLWESEREGFSTIYRSYYDYFFGATAESPKTQSLSVSPCPFTNETTIRLHVSGENGETKIRILDLQGREVKTLIAEKGSDGWQNAVWDGTNNNGSVVSSGSYLVISSSGGKTQSRIIIKQ